VQKHKSSKSDFTFLKGTSALPKTWSKAIDALKKEKLRSMVTRMDLISEMDKIRKHMDDLRDSNEQLIKSNDELRGLLLASLKEE